MTILDQVFTSEIRKRIDLAVESEPDLSRVKLSRQVCEWLNWRSHTGRPQDVRCRVALLKLQRRGLIQLPIGRKAPPSRVMRRGVNTIISKIESPLISCELQDLGEVELISIKSSKSKESRIWNEWMEKHHPLGSGPLCGAQMRYLIRSSRYGCLGGLAFSAAARRLRARDAWIGWDEEARKKHLEKVVCNSRFLILPYVKVPNLASHVLALSARQILLDWPLRYGIKPVLLETFVEQEKFKGTCYRAANWEAVGETCGRGRQDRKHRLQVPIKTVYLYLLDKEGCKVLCEGPPKPVSERPCSDQVEDWAQEEFGTAMLKDERRKKRLLMIARDLYARPQANIPQACQTRSRVKAAYRFFEHEETRMDKILASHYEATLSRVNKEKVVLAVQDTTSLNYSTHPATADLGLIGSKKEGTIGLIVHDTMAFNLAGTPLGLMDIQCWARDPEDFGKKHLRHTLSIEQKESNKWLKSFRKVAEAQKRCPDTTLVSVGDREADIYELFVLALSDPAGPKLLIRSEHDRLLADGQEHLWEQVEKKPVTGQQVLWVPRQKNRPGREAVLDIHFSAVRLKPPVCKPMLGEQQVWAVLAKERNAPEGVTPLEWMLLTTLEVTTFEQATEKLAWYAQRWGIEVYHKTLKSGCKIEIRQLGNADRIEACLAIDLVVAWRIFHLTKLGRETPDVPCTVFFEEEEWKALWTYKNQGPIFPEKTPSLREATRMVASLGGFLGRNSDGEPGTQTIWLGIQRLDDMTYVYKSLVPYLKLPPVSSNPGYG